MPKRFSTASQPHAAPGTVTGKIPCEGMPEPGPQLFGSHRYPEPIETLDGGSRRRRAAGVQDIEPLVFGDVDEREQVAAHTDHHGFHQIESGSRGHRCIDGVAALFQYLQADLCRQRLTGDHHAMLSHDLRASLSRPALGTVASKALAERRLDPFVARCHQGVVVGAGRQGGQTTTAGQTLGLGLRARDDSLDLHAGYYGAFLRRRRTRTSGGTPADRLGLFAFLGEHVSLIP